MLRNTATPTGLRAGEKENVVPGSAEAIVDGRILPGTSLEAYLARVRRVVGPRIEVEVLQSGAPGEVPLDSGLMRVIRDVVKKREPGSKAVPWLNVGFTDAYHLSKLGVQCYGFCPLVLPGEMRFAGFSTATTSGCRWWATGGGWRSSWTWWSASRGRAQVSAGRVRPGGALQRRWALRGPPTDARWSGWRGDGSPLGCGGCGAATEFEQQTVLTACHGPMVVSGEDRLEKAAEAQRLVGADLPVVGDVDERAVLDERPLAAANEIAPGFESETIGARVRHPDDQRRR
ncbi:MAG: peptidase dimerization domain-containing protein [Tepidiformaceae bacterium]